MKHPPVCYIVSVHFQEGMIGLHFNRRGTTILLLALLLVSLAGCARMNVTLQLNADGSADWGMEFLVADSADGSGAGLWEQASAELKAQGCSVTDVQSAGYSGIRAVRHYANVDELASGGAEGGIFSGGSPALSVKADKGFFSTQYDIRGSIKPADIAAVAGETAETAARLLEQAEIKLEITLPVKAAGHNASAVSTDGLTYAWKLNPTGPNTIEINALLPNMVNILIAGGGAFAVLVVPIIVLAVSAKNRQRKAARQKTPGRRR